jgi:Delta3-Delta2-enoyl-CoA isomerase
MILTIEHGEIRELRLNRPPVNALNTELLEALRIGIQSAERDGKRALILSGTPGRFSGGLDVPLLLTLERSAIPTLWRALYLAMQAIAASPIPVVAAITGHAPAGGTVLAMFCDWRVMAEGEYKIGLNEVAVGIPLPPVILGGLRRLVGPRKAEWLGASGALISPAEALANGLIDEVAPVEQVVERGRDWCSRMLALPREAMTSTRRAARQDLVALFDNLESELEQVTATWWHPETQSTLRGLVERIKKKGA